MGIDFSFKDGAMGLWEDFLFKGVLFWCCFPSILSLYLPMSLFNNFVGVVLSFFFLNLCLTTFAFLDPLPIHATFWMMSWLLCSGTRLWVMMIEWCSLVVEYEHYHN